MRTRLLALSALAVLAGAAVATTASAQVPNLSGPYQCVQGCAAGPPALAYVTQNGWDLNLVNEVGIASRAWIDWPGHIWAEAWNQGAIYSPDGATIQFDRGNVWQRYVELPPPPPPPPRHKVRHAKRVR